MILFYYSRWCRYELQDLYLFILYQIDRIEGFCLITINLKIPYTDGHTKCNFLRLKSKNLLKCKNSQCFYHVCKGNPVLDLVL